jgi:hypothetical protein
MTSRKVGVSLNWGIAGQECRCANRKHIFVGKPKSIDALPAAGTVTHATVEAVARGIADRMRRRKPQLDIGKMLVEAVQQQAETRGRQRRQHIDREFLFTSVSRILALFMIAAIAYLLAANGPHVGQMAD